MVCITSLQKVGYTDFNGCSGAGKRLIELGKGRLEAEEDKRIVSSSGRRAREG